MINKLDQFHSIRDIFPFWTKYFWGIDTCFDVEYVLLDPNFDFLGDYLVFTAHYLVVTTGYCSLPLVAARSHFQYERANLKRN